MIRLPACLLSIVCLAAPAHADQTAKQAFEEAFYAEKAERAFAKAAACYERILSQYARDRAIVAKAALRLGLCQEELGQHEKALKSFQRVIKEFPQQAAKAKKALVRIKRILARKKAKTRKAPTKKKPVSIEAILTRRVTLNFSGAMVREVVHFLQDISGANIVVDQAVKDFPVHLRLRKVTMATALKLVADINRLSFATIYGVAMLTTPERLAAMKTQPWPTAKSLTDPADKATFKALTTKSLTMNFPKTEMTEVLDFLRDASGLNFFIKRAAITHLRKTKAANVELRLSEVSLEAGLRLITVTRGLTYRLERGIVLIDRAAAKAKPADRRSR